MLDKQNEPSQEAIDTYNLSRIRQAQEAAQSQNGELRSVFARADLQGLNLEAAKAALKVKKSGKMEDWITKTEKTMEYLRLLGSPVEREQLDLFKQRKPSAPEDEKAKAAGRVAGLLGEAEATNPHDATTKKGMAWLDGYRDGLAERKIVESMPEPHPADVAEDGVDDEE